ncbi:MAG: fumarylacetoacetate hydrolase family protein, partial [Aquincola sp.]|nr:fumarylacetoacetate hydrolase family protein [Aquincola sp.]
CGDVMFTGSPAGTAQGSGRFLKPGDVVEATVEGIGTLRNVVGDKGG